MELIESWEIGCAVFERAKEIFKAEEGAPAEPKFAIHISAGAGTSPTPTTAC